MALSFSLSENCSGTALDGKHTVVALADDRPFKFGVRNITVVPGGDLLLGAVEEVPSHSYALFGNSLGVVLRQSGGGLENTHHLFDLFALMSGIGFVVEAALLPVLHLLKASVSQSTKVTTGTKKSSRKLRRLLAGRPAFSTARSMKSYPSSWAMGRRAPLAGQRSPPVP